MAGSPYYDIQIDDDGDIETEDSFDTAILYALLGERRATKNEIVEPQLRRGWIGNDEYENGSTIWIYYKARMTRNTMNGIEDAAKKALQYLVDDKLAVSIEDVTAIVSRQTVKLSLTIRRSRDRVEKRLFTLWSNTGNAN